MVLPVAMLDGYCRRAISGPVAVAVALGLQCDGKKEIIGSSLAASELHIMNARKLVPAFRSG